MRIWEKCWSWSCIKPASYNPCHLWSTFLLWTPQNAQRSKRRIKCSSLSMENWTMILPLIHTGWVDWASRRQMPSEMVSDHPVLGLGCGTAKVKLGCSIFGNLNSSTIHVSVLCNKTTSDWATEVQWATLDGISGKPRSYSHNWGGGRDSGEGGGIIEGVSRPLWTWPRMAMAKPHSSWCFCSLGVETAEPST